MTTPGNFDAVSDDALAVFTDRHYRLDRTFEASERMPCSGGNQFETLVVVSVVLTVPRRNNPLMLRTAQREQPNKDSAIRSLAILRSCDTTVWRRLLANS
jgi:hypothetical protein